MLIFALVALVAVLVIGRDVAGQRNWIELGGPFRFQPSEFAKLALVLWASDLLARKQGLLDQWKHLLVPLMPVAVAMIGLVLLEGDVGTALILVPMVAAMLYVNGAPLRLFVGGAVVVLAGVAAAQPRARPTARPLHRPGSTPRADPLGTGWQLLRGKNALGGGGWFGVGLGASREKWDWLPEAHTDFIYAVVGEELGILGSLLVLVLFAAIGIAGLRLARTTRTRSCARRPRPSSRGSSPRRCSTSARCSSSSRSPACRCRSCPTAARRSMPTLVALGMLMSFARAEAGRARRRPARAHARSRARRR